MTIPAHEKQYICIEIGHESSFVGYLQFGEDLIKRASYELWQMGHTFYSYKGIEFIDDETFHDGGYYQKELGDEEKFKIAMEFLPCKHKHFEVFDYWDRAECKRYMVRVKELAPSFLDFDMYEHIKELDAVEKEKAITREMIEELKREMKVGE